MRREGERVRERFDERPVWMDRWDSDGTPSWEEMIGAGGRWREVSRQRGKTEGRSDRGREVGEELGVEHRVGLQGFCDRASVGRVAYHGVSIDF